MREGKQLLEYGMPRGRWRWWHAVVVLAALLVISLLVSLVYDPLSLWGDQPLKAPATEIRSGAQG